MRQRFDTFREAVRRRPAPESLDGPAEDGDGLQRPALVVGLGNPGEKYATTRHNVGAWCIRLLLKRHGGQLSRQGQMEVTTVSIEGRRVVLGRPRSYMNESGPPVAAELRRLKLHPRQLLVVYDELDLPVAQVRMRASGGHGGNNGMRSLIGAIGSQEFARIRIGIDRPYDNGRPVRDPDRVAAWVLSRPSGEDRERLEAAVERAANAIEDAVREGVEVAMNRVNALR